MHHLARLCVILLCCIIAAHARDHDVNLFIGGPRAAGQVYSPRFVLYDGQRFQEVNTAPLSHITADYIPKTTIADAAGNLYSLLSSPTLVGDDHIVSMNSTFENIVVLGQSFPAGSVKSIRIFGDNLYVAGGFGFLYNNETIRNLMQRKLSDPPRSVWTSFQTLPVNTTDQVAPLNDIVVLPDGFAIGILQNKQPVYLDTDGTWTTTPIRGVTLGEGTLVERVDVQRQIWFFGNLLVNGTFFSGSYSSDGVLFVGGLRLVPGWTIVESSSILFPPDIPGLIYFRAIPPVGSDGLPFSAFYQVDAVSSVSTPTLATSNYIATTTRVQGVWRVGTDAIVSFTDRVTVIQPNSDYPSSTLRGAAQNLPNIARFSTTTPGPMVGVIGGGTDAPVTSLVVVGGQYFLSGLFTSAYDFDCQGLIAYDEPKQQYVSVGQPLLDNTTLTLNDPPSTILMTHSFLLGGLKYIIAAGRFRSIGQVPFYSLAFQSYDPATVPSTAWQPFPGGGPRHDLKEYASNLFLHDLGTVNVVLEVNGILYLGGDFTWAGGIAATNLVRYSMANQTWIPWVASVDGPVYSIIRRGDEILVGGDFVTINNITVNHIARWDLLKGTWLAAGLGFPNMVTSLAVVRTTVWATGPFSSAAGSVQNPGLAWWDGQTWYWPRCKVCGDLQCQIELNNRLCPDIGVAPSTGELLVIEDLLFWRFDTKIYVVNPEYFIDLGLQTLGGVTTRLARGPAKWSHSLWVLPPKNAFDTDRTGLALLEGLREANSRPNLLPLPPRLGLLGETTSISSGASWLASLVVLGLCLLLQAM